MREGDVRENRGKLRVYLGVARPDHWFKNVLVLAGGPWSSGGPRSMSARTYRLHGVSAVRFW